MGIWVWTSPLACGSFAVWGSGVLLYVNRLAFQFSFMSHDCSESSNLIRLPVFEHADSAQPRIPTLYTRPSLPLGGGVWARDYLWYAIRGGRPRLIIHEYAVTFSGRGFGRVAEVAETQVLEARLACEGRLWMNHHEKHEVWTLLD